MRKLKTSPMAVALPSVGFRQVVLILASVIMGMLSTAAVFAANHTTYSLDIPAQKLGDALQALAFASQHKLLYSSRLVEGKDSPELKGEYTTEEAVKRLLSGTNLSYRFTNDGYVVIHAGNGSSGPLSLLVEVEGSRVVQARNNAGYSTADFANNQGTNKVQDSSAQSTDSLVNRIEEIVVTATKREERLQDVPISITVLSGRKLDAASSDSLNDELVKVPGVYAFDSMQNGGTKFSVRGVTSNASQFNGASAVGYYLDEIPFGFVRLASSPDANAYDLERVEVLRGPQGTLYGASALNGVFRIVTHDADLEESEFKTRLSMATTEGGGDSYRADAAVNVPLIPGKLGLRGTVGYADLGGYIDQPAMGREDTNDAERKSLRLKLNAKPSDNLNVELMTWLNRDDFDGPSTGIDDLTTISTIEEPISSDYDAFGLVVDYAFPSVNVLSATSYMDFQSTGVLDIGPGAFALTTEMLGKVISEEIRLTSTHEGPWKWSLGGIYRQAEDGLYSTLNPVLGRGGAITESRSYAVFGEATYIFADGLFDLTAGLRYFEDRVTLKEPLRAGVVPPDPADLEESFDSVTPRAVFSWHPSDQATIYASYSQGFRSGFPVDPRGARLLIGPIADELVQPVHEDLLTNYEIGFKSTLLNGKVNLDGAAYYIDWNDAVQVISVLFAGGAAGINIPLNSEGISGSGIDLGVSTELLEGLTVGASVSWNDLAFDKDVISRTASSSTILYEKGGRPPESPEETIGAFIGYSLPVGANGYRLGFSTTATYASEVSVSDGAGGSLEGDDFLNLGARISLEAPSSWILSAFGENLANENPLQRPVAQAQWSSRVRPLTFGLQFEYRYGNR